MALAKPTISATVKTALDAEFGATADANAEIERVRFCDAIADALVTILTSQLLVTTTVPGGSSAGVYPGVNT